MDLRSLKCYKRVKKISIAKIKIQKNDKSNTISVQYWHGKYGKVAVILQNLSQLIGALFLCDTSAYDEIRSSSFSGLNLNFHFALSSLP